MPGTQGAGSTDPGFGPIARRVQTALQGFRALVDATKAGHDGPQQLDSRPFLPLLENEVIRFKMWAGNLGAHQAGRASLDYRLREASHLQEQVVYLLRDVSESLQDALAIIRPQNARRDEDTARDIDAETLPDDVSDGSFTDSDTDEPPAETRLSTICMDIREAIDCLLRLSVAIANPAPHERFRKFGAEDISYREPHDIAYVRDKFPKLDQDTTKVLGKAITRRRQFFRYRLAHHEKLAAGLEPVAAKEGDDSRTEIVPKTIASTLPEHIKAMSNIDLRNDIIDEDDRSDTAASMTSYATSAGFLAEVQDGEAPPLRVPALPQEAELGSFECTFCYRMISASTRAAWKRHVFSDLRPYTCLFKGCLDYNTDFERRGQWRAHVSQHHWTSWSCPFRCDGTYTSVSDLDEHLKQSHLPDAPANQLQAVSTLGESPASETTTIDCPICRHSTIGLRQYTRHVGRHLEQLALFALPDIGQDAGVSDEEAGSDSAASALGTDDKLPGGDEMQPQSDTANIEVDQFNPPSSHARDEFAGTYNPGEWVSVLLPSGERQRGVVKTRSHIGSKIQLDGTPTKPFWSYFVSLNGRPDQEVFVNDTHIFPLDIDGDDANMSDGKAPYLCFWEDCAQSKPGHGFTRQSDFMDHLKRVHVTELENHPTGSQHTKLWEYIEEYLSARHKATDMRNQNLVVTQGVPSDHKTAHHKFENAEAGSEFSRHMLGVRGDVQRILGGDEIRRIVLESGRKTMKGLTEQARTEDQVSPPSSPGPLSTGTSWVPLPDTLTGVTSDDRPLSEENKEAKWKKYEMEAFGTENEGSAEVGHLDNGELGGADDGRGERNKRILNLRARLERASTILEEIEEVEPDPGEHAVFEDEHTRRALREEIVRLRAKLDQDDKAALGVSAPQPPHKLPGSQQDTITGDAESSQEPGPSHPSWPGPTLIEETGASSTGHSTEDVRDRSPSPPRDGKEKTRKEKKERSRPETASKKRGENDKAREAEHNREMERVRRRFEEPRDGDGQRGGARRLESYIEPLGTPAPRPKVQAPPPQHRVPYSASKTPPDTQIPVGLTSSGQPPVPTETGKMPPSEGSIAASGNPTPEVQELEEGEEARGGEKKDSQGAEREEGDRAGKQRRRSEADAEDMDVERLRKRFGSAQNEDKCKSESSSKSKRSGRESYVEPLGASTPRPTIQSAPAQQYPPSAIAVPRVVHPAVVVNYSDTWEDEDESYHPYPLPRSQRSHQRDPSHR
ncbi:hypothetical protein B0T16DRAFT_462331 [Cercophora newfieldiana]|uniref:C2H2-type domain-containing protein n=1 Tax=Cercophora newfieldiana TaxID=92897 RepID=A0AA39XRX4_9PEZI|nr:hypothetical protein B0T16DRAFT_462331 [Cercophora newfieldiana]